MTRCTRQTTHAIARGSTIGDRPDVQHGLKIDAVTSEPKPIIENGSTLFKSTTVQKTGSGTPSPISRSADSEIDIFATMRKIRSISIDSPISRASYKNGLELCGAN